MTFFKRGFSGEVKLRMETVEELREEVRATVDRKGPLHLHAGYGKDWSTQQLCGVQARGVGSVHVRLLRRQAGAFEDVPMCQTCVGNFARGGFENALFGEQK